MITRALLGVVLIAVPLHAASAQPLASPIRDVLHDADGDRVPDALGMTVRVAGRASAAAGSFGPKGPSFYLQDETGGLAVALSNRATPAVAEGDSLHVTGVFEFVHGIAILQNATVERVSSAPLPVDPTPYTSAAPEVVEGRLVDVTGIVVGKNRVETGHSLSITLDDHVLLVAFVYAGSPEPLQIDAYEPGDRIRIVGIAGQYDWSPPFQDSYQIYPRSPRDIHRAGIPMEVYRRGVLLVLSLLGLAAIWVTMLKRQVQRRVDQLNRSEDHYRTVVDLASDAIAIHDLEGRTIELNRAACDAIGYTAEDMPSSLLEVIAPEDHSAARAHFLRIRSEGRSRGELRLVSPSGPRFFEFDSQLITLDGDLRILSLARDIGVRMDYERGLIEAREQAEEMARVKSAFLASMSHEIRTPLTAVIGFADLLRYEVADNQLDLVLAIEAGGTRLLNTLNSVLDLAQIDSGGQTLKPKPLDLVEHIDRSLDVLRPMAHGQGLELSFEHETDHFPAVLDHGAFDRILTNLIGNAVKFTDEGGVTIGLGASADTIELTVTDTGIGIDAEFLPDLFSEFRQESEGHARSHEGSGLGLAITERLVRLMDGTIEVDSEKGVGTTFMVTLPLIVPEPEGAESPGTMLVTTADPASRQLDDTRPPLNDDGPTLADLLG